MANEKTPVEKPTDTSTVTEQPVLTATPGKDAPAHIADAAMSVGNQAIIDAHVGLAEVDPALADAADVGFNTRLMQIEAWLAEFAPRLAHLLDVHFQGKI